MSLLKEAGNLYLYSKELIKLNRQLKKYGKLAEKYKSKHHAADEHKKGQYKSRHESAVKNINKLLKRHNHVLSGLRTHYHGFAHYLRKEHKI
tara:strand:+ start:247 stop:522 length:276 start_codon:yes stop_codon:yes gene_type:complete